MKVILYRFYDEADELLYVGISSRIPVRVKSHASQSCWFNVASWVSIDRHPDRRSALLAEKLAIKKELPKYNIVHRLRYSTPQSASARKRAERARMVAAGYRRIEVWAMPDNHREIKAYAERIDAEM